MRKKKIKILHVAQAAGGVDRYIRMLLKYLDNLSLNSVHQYTHQPIIQPLITPTLRSASGQGGSPGSRTLRRSSTTR